MLAEIGHYAAEKYGSWEQYSKARLIGEKGPINHIYEHLRQYVMGERYDHFEGDVGRHLAAVAYNASMEWHYLKKFGHVAHPLTLPSVEQKNAWIVGHSTTSSDVATEPGVPPVSTPTPTAARDRTEINEIGPTISIKEISVGEWVAQIIVAGAAVRLRREDVDRLANSACRVRDRLP